MELDDLYQETILDHHKNPRCRDSIEAPDVSQSLFNPLCGDRIELCLKVELGTVKKISCTGHGCAISQASASMMSSLCRGKSAAEIRAVAQIFKGMMRGEPLDEITLERLGDAVALEGVRRYSARVKCAALAWEAIEKCLTQLEQTATPEQDAKAIKPS